MGPPVAAFPGVAHVEGDLDQGGVRAAFDGAAVLAIRADPRAGEELPVALDQPLATAESHAEAGKHEGDVRGEQRGHLLRTPLAPGALDSIDDPKDCVLGVRWRGHGNTPDDGGPR